MEDFQKKFRKIINFFVAVFIIALLITIICLIMLKYEIEGENNMPFELSQIVTISTAEGIETEGEKTWNFELAQNNDVYLHISKNKNYKEDEIIRRIIINNFKIVENPSKGEIKIYKPSKSENKTFEYIEEYLVGNELIFSGSENSNLKAMELSNQGGVIAFRICNTNLRQIFFRGRGNNT